MAIGIDTTGIGKEIVKGLMDQTQATDKNPKVLLSTLWLFVTVNYMFCDIFTLFHSESLKQLMTGEMGGMIISQTFLLGFAILMEIVMVMIVLSRFLPYKSNRILNITVGLLMTFVQGSTLFTADNTLHYILFSFVEISTTISIVYYAWNWNEKD